MKTTLEQWQKLLCFAKKQYPVILDERGLSIFPQPQAEDTPHKVLALSTRNMVAYWFHLLLAIYPTLDHLKATSPLASYLKSVSRFLSHGNNLTLFYREAFSLLITLEEENEILYEIQQFPPNSEICDPRIQRIHAFIEKFAGIAASPAEIQWRQLYQMNSAWNKEIGHPQHRLLPDGEVLRIVSDHIRHQYTRIGVNYHNNVAWGEEFDRYLTEFSAQGCKPNRAKWLARKKFMEAHPPPVTDQEILEQSAYPGLSQACLQRYRRIYLKSKEE